VLDSKGKIAYRTSSKAFAFIKADQSLLTAESKRQHLSVSTEMAYVPASNAVSDLRCDEGVLGGAAINKMVIREAEKMGENITENAKAILERNGVSAAALEPGKPEGKAASAGAPKKARKKKAAK
jgi:hypothetical protein